MPASGQHSLPPDPKGTAGVFRRVGYELDVALADIIDNSIDAGASIVLVRVVRSSDSLARVMIADNGSGMSEKQLDAVMRYGVQRSHADSDLGKYGIGLKAASFSQCASLTVVTRRERETSGRRWTLDSIAENWTVEVVDKTAASKFCNQGWGPLAIAGHGTVVVWDELELALPAGDDFEEYVAKLIKEITNGLGLCFHRFLQQEKLSIFLDFQELASTQSTPPIPVLPLDPFGYSKTGRKGFPAPFLLEIDGLGKLTMRGYIWPARSKEVNYRLGGGNVAGRQGFYFYRNERLIQAGGWNKHQRSDHEPHLSLARVEIDLPPDFDSAFKLTIQKDAVEPPRAFLAALKNTFSGPMSFPQYLDLARESYRNAEPDEAEVFLVPSGGLPAAAAARIRKTLAEYGDGKAKEIDFAWKVLPSDLVFAIDREAGVVALNKAYRKTLTGGSSSRADAPIVKLLLFFLCESALSKKRLSSIQSDELSRLNAAMLEVIKEMK